MSVWDWLQNKHEWNSLILPQGTENNKDLENKLWHLTALGRWVFCTCPWCFIRTFVLIWTFINELCCICLHSFIPRGVLWSNLNSVRLPSLRLAQQNLKVRSEIRSRDIIRHFPHNVYHFCTAWRNCDTSSSSQCSLLNSFCLQVHFIIVLISSVIWIISY